MTATVKAEIPEKLDFLFQPSRYKVAYGGRGAAKSWNFGRALILMSLQDKKRILCTREIQSSIKDSVHRLLRDQIESLGVTQCFEVTDRSITCSNGSEFLFEGLFRNVNRIKSLEGIDYCWVEEAESVSAESWEVLTPTIRKENSEIWVSFNTGNEDDATYQKFVVNQPENALVRKINYDDNPYFPEVLRVEMEQDKARDPHLYKHKWLGMPTGAGGRVYPSFNKEIHIKDIDMKEAAKKANCFMAMDPHSHYYPFCTWIAIIPKNERGLWPEDFHKHIYAEWPTVEDLGGHYHELRKKMFYTGSLSDLSKEIYAKDGIEDGIKILDRFIDTRYAKGSGGWSWSTSTVGVVELLAKPENGGLKFSLPAEKIIDAQKQLIHSDMLYNVHATLSQFNEPSFSVSPKCKNVIASLSNHRLEDDSEKESEKYKDACDTIRLNYAGLSDFKYKDPQVKKSQDRYAPQGGAGWMG
jgi:hypothetical protein